MSLPKGYLLTVWHLSTKKPGNFPGHKVTAAAGDPAGFHVQDPAVSNIGVEPKGGAALVPARFRLVWVPVHRGLRKSAGAGQTSRRLFEVDSLLDSSVYVRGGSFPPCCPGPAPPQTTTGPYPMVGQEPPHPTTSTGRRMPNHPGTLDVASPSSQDAPQLSDSYPRTVWKMARSKKRTTSNSRSSCCRSSRLVLAP